MSDDVYPSGYKFGDRVRFIGGERKYSTHINFEEGDEFTVVDPPKDHDYPADSIMVLHGRGCCAISTSVVEKIEE